MKPDNKIIGDGISILSLKPFKNQSLFITVASVNNGIILGKFFEKDGKLDFEGNTTKSAEIFVREILKLANDQSKSSTHK